MTHPTGEQYEISSGDQHAVITEVGATLRTYTVGGRDVLLGFGADEVISGGRGQQLIPWPNRIRDGRYPFGGKTQQLALTEPARHNAIHGLTRHVAWDLQEQTEDAVTLTVTVFPQPGWPGILRADLTYRLSDEGLTIELTATNAGHTDVPFGYGAHPYVTAGQPVVDELAFSVPADSYLAVDDRLLPTGIEPVDQTPFDLRSGDALGDRVFDTAFTGLARGDDGRWRVRIEYGDRFAEIWAESGFDWLQIYTGDDRRDIGVAIEPMTCGPDAFNAGPTSEGLLVLSPGEAFTGRWGIRGR